MRTFGTQTISPDGMLSIGGCDVAWLAETFGTPLYVLDERHFRDNCRRYLAAARAAYPGSDVAYASKSLCATAVSRMAHQEGLWLDVASQGELLTALAAGCPPERIIYHGNNKSREEIRFAVSKQVGLIAADWLGELEMLERAGADAGRSVGILLRLAPGVDPDTHQAIRTGQADTKFGLSLHGDAEKAVTIARGMPHLNLLGLHAHVGSQLLDPDANIEAVVEMGRFAEEVGLAPEIVDVGGGLGVSYQPGDAPPTFEAFNGALARAMGEAFPTRPRLLQEPGRCLVGETGMTLYTVGAVKEVQLPDGRVRTYVSVDGGLSDNPRPQLYGAKYEAYVATRATASADTYCRLAGAHCETDTLIPEIMLAEPKPGDILAVPCTGAYNYSMASNYNRFPRPAMVLVGDGHADVIVERERPEDTLRQDRLPERFR